MLGCLGDFIENYDFMILSAILDYELSLICDIWAWVLKLLCLDYPKGIDGYYLSHKCCKCLDASMTHMIYEPEFWNYVASMTRKKFMDIICPINVASVWMSRWPLSKHYEHFTHNVNVGWCLKCDIDMNFYSFIMPQWPEKN
jgi:hypothetical protein